MLVELIEKYIQKFPEESQRISQLLNQATTDDDMYNRKNFRGHLTASGLVVFDGKLLMIKHNFLQKYLQPGGHAEKGESFEEAAKREIMEETSITALKLADWHQENEMIPIDIDTHYIPENPKKNEAEHFHHDFRYIFLYTGDLSELKIQEIEVSEIIWKPFSEITNEGLQLALQKIRNLKLS